MSEFITLAVGVLLEQNWSNGAVKYQVATVEKNLLHCLPSLDRATGQRWLGRVLLSLNWRILERAFINTRRRFGAFQHWASIVQIVTVVVITLVVALVIASTIMWVRLIWIVIIGIVVLLGIHGVIAAGRMNAVLIVAAMEVVDRLLDLLVILDQSAIEAFRHTAA